jgi:two-component system OmpR family sensor kinase
VIELPRLRLGLKVGLVLFGIVAGALTIVYLAVVPQLESRLVDARIRELERASPSVVAEVRAVDQFRYGQLATFFQSNLNARVVIYRRLSENLLLPVADSSGLRSGDVQRDPVALEAATSGARATGRVRRGGQDRAEVAVPVDENTIVLLSASLRTALSDVRLVQRTLLVAGLAALVVSWLAGYLAASHLTRRIHRLEEAAERISAGDFERPVVDTVDDEVGQLARAFDSMRVRLADLDHARREFIANASHELRTPLFALGGFLELLAEEDLEERERREFVAEMTAQVERLTRLATDLLDLTRLDAGQLAVGSEAVDLATVARTVCEEFRAVAEASGHALRVDATTPATARADEQRVLQIGRILLENAIRHTPTGTRVDVRAGDEDGRVALSVRDTGPGIAEAEHQHVFERFYRAEGGVASGSGLGLAIASELAQRMNGSIEVRSELGETVFTLWLPQTRRDEAISRGIDSGKEADLSRGG